MDKSLLFSVFWNLLNRSLYRAISTVPDAAAHLVPFVDSLRQSASLSHGLAAPMHALKEGENICLVSSQSPKKF